MSSLLEHMQVDWVGQTLTWPEKDKNWEVQRLVQFERYADWCEAISLKTARRLHIPGVENLDFLQYGSIGLLEAIERYEPRFGVSFKSFAFRRVRGAIYNSIFRFTEKTHLINWQRNRLDERLYSLTDNDASEEVDAAEMLVTTILDAAIGMLMEQNEVDEVCMLDGESYLPHEIQRLQKSLVDKIQYLPGRQKTVLELHYIEFLNFTAISEELNISKGRVSQLHQKGISSLRCTILD